MSESIAAPGLYGALLGQTIQHFIRCAENIVYDIH